MVSSKKKTELAKRVLTGVLGGVLFIAILVGGGKPGVQLVAVVMASAMAFELGSLFFSLADRWEKRFLLTAVCGGLTWALAVGGYALSQILPLLLVVLCSYFLFQSADLSARGKQWEHVVDLMVTVFGALYLGYLPSFLVSLYDLERGLEWLLFFFAINWSGDILAYFVGRKWGRHRLAPQVSPKKSVEGAVAAFIAAGIMGWLAHRIAFPDFPLPQLLTLSVVVSGVAQVGDLCESLLKRAVDQKDSGGLLPGHGGFLDRFDGVVFSIPVMYTCVNALISHH